LVTSDANGLYEKYGFEKIENPAKTELTTFDNKEIFEN